MEAIKEITKWDGTGQPNHTYLMNGDSIVAYIKKDDTFPFFFKNPIKGFKKTGRKFVSADVGLFGSTSFETSLVTVQGSNGKVYSVDPEAKTCTCTGFTFRGKCKHLEMV
jgi:hypothetical protein